MIKKRLILGTLLAIASTAVLAQVKVGVIVGSTGSQAALGVPLKSTFSVLPDTLGGQSVEYIVLDDGSDPTNSVKLARKLMTDDKVDIIFGTSSVPGTIAMAPAIAEQKTPLIALAPASPQVAKNPWAFFVAQPTPIMMTAVVEHMKKNNVKTVGYVGFSDSWGDLVLAGFKPELEKQGIKLVADVRYARNDTSVMGPVLKVIKDNPDAVVVGGSGTGSALAHITLVERGYKGQIYHNHAVINKDFLRVGGKHLEGAIAPTGPVLVAEQIPDSNVIKPVALEFLKAYERKYGEDSRNAFSAYSYDSYILADQAVRVAAEKYKPGTPEFRQAVRDALETNKEVVGSHAVYNMTPTDHTGVDERARVLVQVKNGNWNLID